MNLQQTKRIIYILLGILVLALIAFLLWRYLIAPAGERIEAPGERVTGRVPEAVVRPEGKTPETLKPGETLEVAPEQILTRLTDFPVIAPSLNQQEDRILFYKKEGGDLFSSGFGGENQEKLSRITVVGMINAFWSPARDRAAVFYLDGDSLRGFLHIGTSSVATLPQDIESFSWSPDGKSLAYLRTSTAGLELVVSDANAKNQRVIFETPIRDAKIRWVAEDAIYFLTAPSGFADGYTFRYRPSSGSFNKLVGPIFSLWGVWSPDGSRLLTSETIRGKNTLRLAARDANGEEIFSPAVGTFAQKCVFVETKEAWCGVPKILPPKGVLTDEYLRGEISTSDKIVAINFEEREVRNLFDSGDFDVSDLVTTKDKSYLFWVNRKDGTLWSLKLK